MQKISTDILIIGGGIAGLWTMNILRQRGYSVVLCEKDTIGAGQTSKAQGIIHGGLKYALSGSTNSASSALSDMPARWQRCLEGTGEIDLSDVVLSSPCQYMWSTDRLTGSLATLFASKSLQSHVSVEDQQPEILRNSKIKTKLYRLSELVLNVPSLLESLVKPHSQNCIQLDYPPSRASAQRETRDLISAQKYIFTAGKGNGVAYKNMQLRPLHMVLVKSPRLSSLYGHCVGMNTVPRITITTHIAHDGTPVWYLGGKLSEDGVHLSSAEQVKKAQQELADIFPQLDLRDAQWASFFVDRAEAAQADGSKPDGATVFADGDKIIAWPTKLALAPVVADQICAILEHDQIKPQYPMPDLSGFPQAKVATPIWDQLLA